MNDFIFYLKRYFSHHLHLDIALRVLACLDYIEQNIEMIAAQVGKKSMLRHPENHLAFHLRDYHTADVARDQLIKLVSEVRGCLLGLMSIEDEAVKQAVISSFLNNINDSAVGCMEARLRPALKYYVLYCSSGCRHIDDLMREFFLQYPSATIADVISFFAAGVECRLQLRDHNGDIQPLSWEWVKQYMKSVISWHDIDTEWQSAAQMMVQPKIIRTPSWLIHQFDEQVHADRYLSYVKSMLPSLRADLEKADVTFDTTEKLYFFRLTHSQFISFQALYRDFLPAKDKEEVDVQAMGQESNQPADLLFSDSCKLTRTPAGLVFSLPSMREAMEALTAIQTKISHRYPEIDSIKINHHSEHIYQFELTYKQFDFLQDALRVKAGKVNLKFDFVIKSIRVDEKSFFRNFVEMVASPNMKHVLRTGKKKSFTVTGSGIYARNNKNASAFSTKLPQYQSDVKQGYSKAQSSSYGFPGCHPMVFGFNKRRTKLVGVIIRAQNILLSDRLFIYDGGTVDRPYDFDDETLARVYHHKKSGTVLFSHARLDDFKRALLANRSSYNEALARLRWGDDHSSIIFIGGDSLDARLWAQDYACIMQRHLVAQGKLHADQPLTICYYLPDNPDLHLTLYTQAEQQLDRLAANAIYSDEKCRFDHYRQKNYDFLLALPANQLATLFNEVYEKKNLILTILSEGYFHLVQSLIEKAEASGMPDLYPILFKNLVARHNKSLIKAIQSHSLEKLPSNFAKSMLIKTRFDINRRLTDGHTCLMLAARNGRHDIVTALLCYPGIDVNLDNNLSCTALMLASSNGHDDIVTALLGHPDINVSLARGRFHDDNNAYLYTALMMAARNGHQAVVTALLSHPGVDVNQVNNFYTTALMFAAENGFDDVVTTLLSHPGINVNEKDSDHCTALITAAKHGHQAVVTALLSYPDININYGYLTALMAAAQAGHQHIVSTLLSHPGIKVNIEGLDGCTALNFAVRNNRINVVATMINSGHTLFLKKTDFIYLSSIVESNEGAAADILSYLLKHHLPRYVERRSGYGEYITVFGKLFGDNKANKFAAVNALLIDGDLAPHQKALSGGELNRIYQLIQKCRDTLRQKNRPIEPHHSS